MSDAKYIEVTPAQFASIAGHLSARVEEEDGRRYVAVHTESGHVRFTPGPGPLVGSAEEWVGAISADVVDLINAKAKEALG